jgi:hypothetical protein
MWPELHVWRLALDTELVALPGAHMGYLSEPPAFAEALRPVLRTLA